MPIANELPLNRDLQVELYPLDFKICFNCGLGQVGEPVSSVRLFEDYRYASSISETWVEHAFQFTRKIINEIKFEKNDFVLEIASNDGYLLQHFNNSGIRTIGVEPAVNISQKANLKGIETINKFFSEQVAIEIRSQYGVPRLIVANNVLAHVPNVNDFFSGINQLSDTNTVVTIENPSIINLLNKNQFDTIYHEHFSYLSANSVSRLADQHNLVLTSVEKLGTHGGTNRYFLRKKGHGESDKKVYKVIKHEIEKGLFDRVIWKDTSRKIQKSIYEIGSWLRQKHQSGDKVIGFTAAAKTSTLINSAVHDSKFLNMVIDSSAEKQGRFIPYPMIPIVDVETAKNSNPTDIVIFSWNIYPEIKKLVQSEFDKSTKCWILIPEIIQIK